MNLNKDANTYIDLMNLLEDVSHLFLTEQQDLILSGVSERSWYLHFARYLNDKIKEKYSNTYYVDIEYNRNNGKLKTIFDNENFLVISITCDIIVHSRGKNLLSDNLICIEMKKSTASKNSKLEDKRRLELLTKKSFDDVWSADGKALPEHVCGYKIGLYYELNLRTRKVHREYYQYGKKVAEKENTF